MKIRIFKSLLSITLVSLATGFAFQAIGKGNPEYECPGGKTYPVTLTFDDGPNTTLTPKVLDVLKAQKVKGTFFVLGENFAGGVENPNNAPKYALLKRMKAEGHVVGSHTYSHLAHNTLSYEAAKTNINKATNLVDDYLSPVLRLPYGAGSFHSKNAATQAKNDQVMNLVKKGGFTHVGWDIDTNDWDAKKRPYLVSSMMKQICSSKGGVILFHDIQKNTVEHLNEWIQIIKDQGHQLVGLEHFYPEAAKKYGSSKGEPSPEDCPTSQGKVHDTSAGAVTQTKQLDDLIKKIIEKESSKEGK